MNDVYCLEEYNEVENYFSKFRNRLSATAVRNCVLKTHYRYRYRHIEYN